MQDMGIEIVEKKIIIGMDKVAYVNALTKLFPPWRSQNIVELTDSCMYDNVIPLHEKVGVLFQLRLAFVFKGNL